MKKILITSLILTLVSSIAYGQNEAKIAKLQYGLNNYIVENKLHEKHIAKIVNTLKTQDEKIKFLHHKPRYQKTVIIIY